MIPSASKAPSGRSYYQRHEACKQFKPRLIPPKHPSTVEMEYLSVFYSLGHSTCPTACTDRDTRETMKKKRAAKLARKVIERRYTRRLPTDLSDETPIADATWGGIKDEAMSPSFIQKSFFVSTNGMIYHLDVD